MNMGANAHVTPGGLMNTGDKTLGQTGRSLTQKVPDVLKVLRKLKNLESDRCKEDNTTDGYPTQDVILFLLLSSKAFKLL